MVKDLREHSVYNKEYDYDLDLNWRDDGDVLGDASMNDYLKGYQIEPYAFQQWAKDKKKNIKIATKEVIVMQFYPEYLADYILTLWNGIDGALQDFFEGFTLRYNNDLKIAIANELKKKGYKVFPVLVDDRAFYANKRLVNIIKTASKKDVNTKIAIAKELFKKSEALKLCFGEIDDITEMGTKVTASRVSDLLQYYSAIFPEDYAICLTKNLIDNKIDTGFENYQDYGISDDGLNSMEKMLSGNQDSYFEQPNGGNTNSTDMGYDYVSQMRGFDGVRPEQYELPVLHAKKKI